MQSKVYLNNFQNCTYEWYYYFFFTTRFFFTAKIVVGTLLVGVEVGFATHMQFDVVGYDVGTSDTSVGIAVFPENAVG